MGSMVGESKEYSYKEILIGFTVLIGFGLLVCATTV